MLKLEQIRFAFSPVVTYGIIYSRAGWSAFTGESVVRPDGMGERGFVSIIEGLYSLKIVNVVPQVMAVALFDEPTHPASAMVVGTAKAALARGDIAIGYGLDMVTGLLTGGEDANRDLVAMVHGDGEAFLNIRHLDNTQHAHFERMRKAVSR